VILALASVSFACSKSTNSPQDYVVAYEVTGNAGVHFDSTKYDDGHGTFIKVMTPSSGWLVSVNAASGGSVEAYAWGTDSSGVQWAKIKATWTPSVGSAMSDSSVAASSGAGSGTFTIGIVKRQLP